MLELGKECRASPDSCSRWPGNDGLPERGWRSAGRPAGSEICFNAASRCQDPSSRPETGSPPACGRQSPLPGRERACRVRRPASSSQSCRRGRPGAAHPTRQGTPGQRARARRAFHLCAVARRALGLIQHRAARRLCRRIDAVPRRAPLLRVDARQRGRAADAHEREQAEAS